MSRPRLPVGVEWRTRRGRTLDTGHRTLLAQLSSQVPALLGAQRKTVVPGTGGVIVSSRVVPRVPASL